MSAGVTQVRHPNLLASCIKDGRNGMELVMLKFHVLVSPSRKNQVLALPSMGIRSVSARQWS